jgi:hypothetical protein
MKKAKTPQEHVDQLITWYEENKPSSGREIRVDVTEAQALCFDGAAEIGGKIWYRNRILIPIGRKPSRKAAETKKKGTSMTDAFRRAWGQQ